MGMVIFVLSLWGLPLHPACADEHEEHEEQTVTLNQVPHAVRKTIERESAGGNIGEIEKEVDEGKTVYEAEFKKDGEEFEIKVAESGKLLAKEKEHDDDDDEHEGDEGDEEDEDEVKVDFESTPVGQIPEGALITETAGTGKTATWKVIEMDGAPSGKKVLALTESKNSGHTFNLVLAKEANLKDLEVSVKVKAMTGEEDQGGGPVWRAKDGDNYYIARWNPLEDNFRVYYVKNGRRKQLGSAKVKADPSKWHEIEVKMVGNRIKAELDDEELISVEDDTFTQPGMVGVWTKADAASAFDDFKVEKKNEEEKEGHHHDDH